MRETKIFAFLSLEYPLGRKAAMHKKNNHFSNPLLNPLFKSPKELFLLVLI
jgi:hypothetical protein